MTTEFRKYDERASWGEVYMLTALVASRRSADPNTQVGACIVHEGKIVATGYNGPPKGMAMHEIPWDREGEPQKTKYPYIVHAELNAILACPKPPVGGRIYTTLFPCPECTKTIIQSGIKSIWYLDDSKLQAWQREASATMLLATGIHFERFLKEELLDLNQEIHDILNK
jgi:dCMP deaminase